MKNSKKNASRGNTLIPYKTNELKFIKIKLTGFKNPELSRGLGIPSRIVGNTLVHPTVLTNQAKDLQVVTTHNLRNMLNNHII